jgi:hypothetical protein
MKVKCQTIGSNKVTVYNMVKQVYTEYFVGELIRFNGSEEQAYQLALTDDDQYVIKEILGYRGSPLARTNLEFYVLFNIGSKSWVPWKDMNQTEALYNYMVNRPYMSLSTSSFFSCRFPIKM